MTKFHAFFISAALLLCGISILNAQEHDPRSRTYISPTRVVWQSDAGVQLADVLLKPGNGQAYCNNDTPTSYCILSSENGAAPGVLLDYGKELHGGLQIVTGWFPGGPVQVRVRYGESASEAMSDVGGKGGATNDHAIRDQIILLPMMGVVEIGNSGYRFVRIDLAEPDRTVKLKEVRAISIMRDLDYAGTFRCSDERLNRIWETGAYTVHLCMQNFLIEGIKRDRLVWMGDSYPEVMTVATVFGGNEVVPKTLDWMRDVTPLPNWMNGEFSSYSIWWMLCHQAWFHHTGEKDYLLGSKEYITGLLRQLIGKIGPDGRECLDGIRFLDWPSQENELAKNAGLQALMVWAMQAGQEFASIFDDTVLASECADAEKRLSKAAPKVYKEFLKSGVAPDAPGSKQAAALMTLAGLTDAKKADRDILGFNGGHGFSTFYGYLMLEAMARAGDWQGALDIIRSYWGAMLDLGATTFWEDFNLDWLPNAAGIDNLVPEGKKDIHGDFGAYCYQGFRHSLCHGWASGPTAWLSHHVLGVEIVEPGCAKVRITPHLGDLDWVEGMFPTPYGPIRVRHERQPDGSVHSDISVPDGVELIREGNERLVSGKISALDIATRRHISENMPMSTRTRTTDSLPHLGLPHPFSVPQAKGRTFMDLFYWDTYFTNLGLLSLGDVEQAKNNVDDILYLIDKYGYMPNAANTGLLNRSQPPYASMMARDVYERTGDREWLRGAVETLEKEYNFWMKERITPSGLNRHFNSATKAELLEFYAYISSERFPQMGKVPRTDDEKVKIASNYLSEAEGGWDFNPRFGGVCEECNPVDLNANLYLYEKNFAWFCRELGQKGAKTWEKKAKTRRDLIQKLCYEPSDGLFYDYNYVTGKRSDVFSSAVFNLLWAGIPTGEQAASLVENLGRLECANGVAACEDGERNAVYQWDYPNAWASFNTLAVVGLDKYGYKADAARIAEKYLNSVSAIYGRTGQLWEKYNAVTGDIGVKAEYAMPGDFMGWTAGAYLVCYDYLVHRSVNRG